MDLKDNSNEGQVKPISLCLVVQLCVQSWTLVDVRCDLISALFFYSWRFWRLISNYQYWPNGQSPYSYDDLSNVKKYVPVLKLALEIIKYEPAWILAPLFFSDILSIFPHYLHKVGPDFFYWVARSLFFGWSGNHGQFWLNPIFPKEGPDHTRSRNYHFQDHFGSVIIGPHYITKNYELCVVFGLDVSWSSWMVFETSIFLRNFYCLVGKKKISCQGPWAVYELDDWIKELIWVWLSKTMVNLCILDLWAVCCVWVGCWVVGIKCCLSMVDLCIYVWVGWWVVDLGMMLAKTWKGLAECREGEITKE